jgi:hypothetical protein
LHSHREMQPSHKVGSCRAGNNQGPLAEKDDCVSELDGSYRETAIALIAEGLALPTLEKRQEQGM